MHSKLPQVIIFQEDEKALNYRFKLPFELNSEIAVKSIEYDLEGIRTSGVKLLGPRPLKDSIYYLHPYKNNEYVHESLGEMYFLNEKLDLYKRVGALLGAKSIATKVVLTESKKLEIDVEGKLRVKVIKAELDVKNSEESKYRETLEINDTYILQDNFDLHKNIGELRKTIEKLNLHHELGMISLINARDSRESGTILTTRKVKSEISSEYNSLLQISAQLSSPVFSVGSDFNRSLETVNKLNIDIEFQF